MSRKPLLWLSLLVLSCSTGPKPGSDVTGRPGQPGSGGTGGSDLEVVPPMGGGADIITCDPSDPTSMCGPNAPPPANCGDGMLTSDEACDDGNLVSGDGCAANCLAVERGYSCNPPGKPCRQIARCGDGVVADSEACDDGNAVDGDGCSTRCRLEIGFKCSGMPSVCSHTTCGDNVKEGAESCDDGNAVPFDGCSSTCQTEPDCSMSGGCKSACGDGLVIDEECDDGNVRDGDGCSSDCKLEAGFTCTQADNCEMINGACVLRVPVVYHDFKQGTPSDFQVTCGDPIKGLVKTQLSDDGVPVLVSATGNPTACIASADSFAEWYRDSKDSNTVVDSLLLFDNGNGGFVNRYGAMGEQWEGYSSTVGRDLGRRRLHDVRGERVFAVLLLQALGCAAPGLHWRNPRQIRRKSAVFSARRQPQGARGRHFGRRDPAAIRLRRLAQRHGHRSRCQTPRLLVHDARSILVSISRG
ncbi:MAG: DUF4215 domain-containing protein [Pseudomonadota bacterium]